MIQMKKKFFIYFISAVYKYINWTKKNFECKMTMYSTHFGKMVTHLVVCQLQYRIIYEKQIKVFMFACADNEVEKTKM